MAEAVAAQDPSCCPPLPLHPLGPYPGYNSRNPVDFRAFLPSFTPCANRRVCVIAPQHLQPRSVKRTRQRRARGSRG